MIGNLDQRITLQSCTTTVDDAGGRTKTWANFATVPTVWARVQNAAGSEINDADGIAAVQKAVFTIRNRTDVTEKDRIVWDGANWNIREVKRMGSRQMYLKIIAERGVA